jgi:type I restriction enzyme S subunit
MENNLPDGWVECSLGEILNAKKGRKPLSVIYEPKTGYIPYILIDEMEGKPVRSYTNDPKVSIIDESEVLLVWDGSIGKCGSGLKGAIGSTLVGLKALGNIQTKFLEYTIKQQNNFIRETSTGTGLQHINKDFFKNCKIPLPPLSEQHRIVSKLDALFQRLENNKLRLEKIHKLLKRFRQSVLNAAVTGKLTEDWREKIDIFESANDFIKFIKTAKGETEYIESDISETWASVRIGEVFEIERGSSPRPKKDDRYFSKQKTDFHWIMLSDFTDNTKSDVLITTNEYLTKEGTRYSRYVNQNDILVGVSGVYGVGRTCLLDIEGYIYDGIMAIKGVKEISLRKFIHYFLLLQRMKFLEVATGTSWPNINTTILKEYVIPIPPLTEQEEIVIQVEKLFAFADKIEARYTKAKAMLDKLPQSILAKAFRGELVPQDANDEPASMLLERIKAEKALFNHKGTQRKKVR